MSCFLCEHAASSILSIPSLVCVPCFMLERGVRMCCSSFDFVSGFGNSRSMFYFRVQSRVRSGRALLSACVVVVFCVAHGSCSAACFLVVLCCCTWLGVPSAMCFHVLFEHAAYECSHYLCWCLVLHMAGDLFCWPCACVLCEHMAFVFVFCVPCALMSIILTPPPPSCYLVIQVTWFTLVTLVTLSFAPYLFSLCVQSCASSLLNVPLLSPVLLDLALLCSALSCLKA